MDYLNLATEIEDFVDYGELTKESTIGELLESLTDAWAED